MIISLWVHAYMIFFFFFPPILLKTTGHNEVILVVLFACSTEALSFFSYLLYQILGVEKNSKKKKSKELKLEKRDYLGDFNQFVNFREKT